MKAVKKLLSIALVLTLVLSLGVTAFASTVSLPDDAKDHTMVAYQIFKGEQLPADVLQDDAGSKLGITAWGDGVDSDALIKALNASPYSANLANDANAEEVAKFLKDYVSVDDQARVALANVIAGCVKGNGKTFENGTADLENGYWVIVDKTEDLAEKGSDSRSTVLLEVVGKNLTLQDKIDKPTVEKKVNGEDNDVAELGEIVKFTATTKLPENFGDFQHYYVKFVDNMGKGLEPVQDTEHQTTIQIGSHTENITLTWNPGGTYDGGQTFTYQSAELKSTAYSDLKAGDTVVLTYYAKITEDAVVRNYNDVTLYYPNDPNFDGQGTPPETPTPEDTVVVFTFFVDGTKVRPGAEEGKFEPLAGAAFTLYKAPNANGEYTVFRPETKAEGDDTNGYKFDFGRLGEGFYRLEETVVPAGYNKADDVYFEIREHRDDDGNVDQVTVWIKGEDGQYHEANGEQFSFNVSAATPAEGEGHLKEQIINRDGLELPETGGIGTTIFYVIGAVLVAAAVVLLVTKKRVNGAEK